LITQINLTGNPINTIGNLPTTGEKAPNFTLVKDELSVKSLSDHNGKRVLLNIFPSIDTAGKLCPW
jgi:thioredoxin-dependent peroxiredoxin